MTTFAQRKRLALQAKHASLQKDFTLWLGLAEKGFGIHTSQLAGLIGDRTGALVPLAAKIAADIDELDLLTAEEILKRARPLEEMLLGLHCLWSFFREKLSQRFNESMRSILDAADELAWCCYRPAMAASGTNCEPPLSFLNGELSPGMLSRGIRWTHSEIASDLHSDPTFSTILKSLPIPVIGVPYGLTTHLPELIFVAHETGHAVEDDFKLTETLKASIRQKLGNSSNVSTWEKWLGECFADAWAVAHVGPAYVGALQDFLAPDHQRRGDYVYPPVAVRVRLARALVSALDFPDEAQTLANDWVDAQLQNSPSQWDNDLSKIADVLLDTPLLNDQSARTLGGYDKSRHQDVIDTSKIVEKGEDFANPGARTLIAAARCCFERKPEGFAPDRSAVPETSHQDAFGEVFLRKLIPSDSVRSARSAKSIPPDLYRRLRDISLASKP